MNSHPFDEIDGRINPFSPDIQNKCFCFLLSYQYVYRSSVKGAHIVSLDSDLIKPMMADWERLLPDFKIKPIP